MTQQVPDFRELGKQYSNWGRWGEDDELGTLNFITPQAIAAACQSVRDGKVFSLGIPFDENGPQPGGVRINPVRLMSQTGHGQDFPGGFRYADDFVFMPLQCATQWDALAHVYYDDRIYNGYPASVVTTAGALKCSIDKVARGIVGRGVLLDVARHKGERWLPPNFVIDGALLEEVARAQGVEIRPGDILLFRTGWRTKFVTDGNRQEFMSAEPGLGLRSIPWLYEKQVAAVASDNWAIEAFGPNLFGEDPNALLPVHMVLIRDMGMTLGEMFDLDELAEDCARDGRWDFLFVGPPIKFTRAVGSPVNPLAIK
jgi:kynurenine formamidase